MKIFLDDFRNPHDCLKYMHERIGPRNLIYKEGGWYIVRNYPEFVTTIQKYGLPELISFDHDLADGHYHQNMQEGKIQYWSRDFVMNDMNKTGWHCAKWLVDYCLDYKKSLPEYIVHSMNPVGTENIQNLLDEFKKFQEKYP